MSDPSEGKIMYSGHPDIDPLLPGFQNHPPAWFKDNDELTAVEKKFLIKYLEHVIKELDNNDPVRWEEWGVVPDYLEEHELVDGKGRTADSARWKLCSIYRWSNPIRLVEGIHHLEWMVRHFESYRNQKIWQDPVLCAWLGVALELRGDRSKGDQERAWKLLSYPEMDSSPKIGPRNSLMLNASRLRLLLDAGKTKEARDVEKKLVTSIKRIRHDPVPSVVLCQLGSSAEHILDILGRDYYEGWIELGNRTILSPSGIIFTVPVQKDPTHSLHFSYRPLEANKRDKKECWVSGCRKTKTLMACAKCKTALYCSNEHQKFAWPRHKMLCKRIYVWNKNARPEDRRVFVWRQTAPGTHLLPSYKPEQVSP